LAIPVLLQQGVFYEALRVFSGIGPAFLRAAHDDRAFVLDGAQPVLPLWTSCNATLGRKLLGTGSQPEIRDPPAQGGSTHWPSKVGLSSGWTRWRRQPDEPKSDTTWL
jgi:hypothetical protein